MLKLLAHRPTANVVILLLLGFISEILGMVAWRPGQPEMALWGIVWGNFLISTAAVRSIEINQQRHKQSQREQLVAIIESIRGRNAAQSLPTDSPRCFRALVLCGGGPKGAYQIGCLRALTEENITFDLICGASAGALNAAIAIGRNDLDGAMRLWQMPRSEILKINFSGFLIAILRIISARFNNSFLAPQSNPLRKIIAFGLILVSGIIVNSDELFSESFFLFVSAQFFFVGMLPIGIAYLLWQFLEYLNAPIFSNRRLREILIKELPRNVIRQTTNTIVVVATRLTQITIPGTSYGLSSKTRTVTVPTPTYIKTNELSSKALRAYLIASAAIPMGILQRTRFSGKWFIDGGITDNCPVLPAIEAHATEIFVVHTNKAAIANGERITTSEGLLMHLLRTSGLRSLADAGQNAALLEFARPWTPINLEHATKLAEQLVATRIIHIIPSRELGSLMVSIFRHSATRASELSSLGYSDTRELVQEF
jgi:predicted acylesterase/phospholipase RssA